VPTLTSEPGYTTDRDKQNDTHLHYIISRAPTGNAADKNKMKRKYRLETVIMQTVNL